VYVWSIPLCRVAQEESKKNLVCHFLTLLQVSTNFRSLNYFLLFKINRNGFKNPGTVLSPVRPGATAHEGGGLPQTVLKHLLGLWPAGSAYWPKRSDWPTRRGARAPVSTSGRRGGAIDVT
jgi:hypothetical protein